MGHIVAIDGNSLLHRVYHGSVTRGVSLPGRLVEQLDHILHEDVMRPDWVAVAVDATDEVNVRRNIDPSYKLERQEKNPKPPELVAAWPRLLGVISDDLGIPVVSMIGYEADDVLASIARDGERRGHDVTIVTTDGDLTATVTERVSLLLINNKQGPRLYDVGTAADIYGVPPSKVPVYKALCGDTSDGIKGVPGIGPKAALKLLGEASSLKEVLDDPERFKRPGKLLQEHEAAFRTSLALVRLHSDIPYSVMTRSRSLQDMTWTDEKRAALREKAKAARQALRA